MKKLYKIKRTLWYQGELTAREDEQVADIHKFVLDSLYSSQSKIGDAIDALYSKQEGETVCRLERIVKVALKPYAPTIFHRLWNSFWMARAGMTVETVYDHIPKSVLVQIVADFFFFDLNWIPNLVNSIVSSVSSLQKVVPLVDQSTMKS